MGKNETCPNCRSRIRKEDLLKNSILDNIIAITKIVGNYEKCKTHSKNLELYCVKCDKKLCSDCLIMETKNCEHFLVRNEEVGNEIFKAMAAIGFSYKKEIFCFPWLSNRRFESYHENLTTLLQILEKLGKTVIIPVGISPPKT